MVEPSRRRRLVARLAAGARHPADVEWADELRVLPNEPPAAPVEERPAAEVSPTTPLTPPPIDFPVAEADPPVVPKPTAAAAPRAAAAAAFNPGPLPDPLPPPLDAAVRGLREDLLAAGPDAAGLADEICARHRDRLRAVLAGLSGGA